ncbi:ParB/RepB/Spo0J family partition protein [Actinomadura fulvescens]
MPISPPQEEPAPDHERDPRRPIDRHARTGPSEAVPIGALREGYSPRRVLDEEHVHRLAQTESPLPPILVHRPTMRIVDGVHRLRAAVLSGREEIEVTYFDGSDEDAFIRAVAENISHGLPLSLTDRKAAAMRIIRSHPDLSDRTIAGYTGLAAKTIAGLRCSSAEYAQSNRRMGADGRLRPTSWIEGRHRAAEAIVLHPEASLREIARIAAVSVGTAHDVRKRLSRGEDPAPARQHSGTGRNAAATAADELPAKAPDPPRRPDPLADTAPGKDTAGEDIAPGQDVLRASEPPDPTELLRKLTKDPAIRHTEVGRGLLRVLHARSVADTDWSELVEAVPPHCAAAIATIARVYAEAWQRFACAVDRQGKSADE